MTMCAARYLICKHLPWHQVSITDNVSDIEMCLGKQVGNSLNHIKFHCFLSINGCNHSNEFVSKCVQILAGRQESEAKSIAIASCARTIHAYGHEVGSCLEIIEQRDNARAIHSISARCYNMWLRFSQGTHVKSCMNWRVLFERDHSRAMVNCDTDHKQGPVDLSVLIITRDFNVGLHFR